MDGDVLRSVVVANLDTYEKREAALLAELNDVRIRKETLLALLQEDKATLVTDTPNFDASNFITTSSAGSRGSLAEYREAIPRVFIEGEALPLNVIFQRLNEKKPESKDLPASSFRSLLSRLEKDGKLDRVRKGLYKLNSNSDAGGDR